MARVLSSRKNNPALEILLMAEREALNEELLFFISSFPFFFLTRLHFFIRLLIFLTFCSIYVAFSPSLLLSLLKIEERERKGPCARTS